MALFYAYNFTVAKTVTPEHIGPFGLTWYRVFCTGSIFWVLALIFRSKDSVPLKEMPLIALAAMCGVGFNMITFMWGLSLTAPINAAVLMVTTPILVMLLSALILKEPLNKFKVSGIGIGFLGAAYLIYITSDGNNHASNPVLGNLLILLNAIFYAFYIILAKKLTAKYHVFTLMRWLYFFGLLIISPFCIQEAMEFNWSIATTDVLFGIGYVILFATFGTYMLNIIAIKNLKPSVVAVFVYLQPLLASIIAISLGADNLSFQKIVAGILIFAGVYLTTLGKQKKA